MFRNNLLKLKQKMNENNIDLAIITDDDSLYYFTGYCNFLHKTNNTILVTKFTLFFININSQKRGDVLADVISAEELVDDQKNKIKNQLKSILGKKLSLNFNVDKKIIGGLINKVGSKMVDSSLATKINKLRIAMGEV